MNQISQIVGAMLKNVENARLLLSITWFVIFVAMSIIMIYLAKRLR